MTKQIYHADNRPSVHLEKTIGHIKGVFHEAAGSGDNTLLDQLCEKVIRTLETHLKEHLVEFENAAVDSEARAGANEFMLSRVRGIVENGYAHMGFTDMDHHEFAGMVRMLNRHHIDHESIIEAARNRIVYLADQVADLTDVVNAIHGTGVEVLKDTTYEERSYKNLDADEHYQNVCSHCLRTFEGPKNTVICDHCSTHNRQEFNKRYSITTLARVEHMLNDGAVTLSAKRLLATEGLVVRYRTMLLSEREKLTEREAVMSIRKGLDESTKQLYKGPTGHPTFTDTVDYCYEVETGKSPRKGLSPAQKLLERKRAERAAKHR